MTKILSNKSNIDLDYPICRPSLDLDFTQEVLDPRITFSRGSIGTRVNRNRLIETVSTNLPRFDYDPVTGECKGLLNEESRSNSLLRSEDFTTTWGASAVSVSSNVITAPDGNTTADKLVENTSFSSFKFVSQSVGTIVGTYTVSAFFKAGERFSGYIQLLSSGGNATAGFNLRTGTIIGGSGTITPYGNGWYRVSSTATFTSATATVYIVLYNINGITNYTGDGTSGIYVWGAQVEEGAFPTSYIPTTASTVTRSADLVEMTRTNFSSWYNQSEGTIYSNTRMNGVQIGRYDRLWAITNSNLNLEGISVFVSGPAGVSGGYVSSITITNSATEQIDGTLVEGAITTPKLRSAFSFKTNDCASAYNGILRFVDKSAILLSNPDRLLIGQPQRFQGTSCMTISRLTYYPRKLKDNQLLYLTQ
jgi:hypothetical protein